MVTRLEVNENEKCLEPYKQETEAMVFKHGLPMYLLEYKKNKLLVSGDPTHMYLVDDWDTVILIPDPNSANTLKTFAFPIPEFDEDTNPFMVVLG